MLLKHWGPPKAPALILENTPQVALLQERGLETAHWELLMQGPKRRKMKPPAYLKEDFVTVGITVDQAGSPNTPAE